MKYKIRVMVTHQVQHLKDADQIIVLKNGQIEEDSSAGKWPLLPEKQ